MSLCIDVRGLSKSYGSVMAVDGLDFTVQGGSIFGFLGPNGAGKSTTIKLLTTLVRPTSGEITILGIDARKNPLQVRRKIGVVLQQPSYEPTLSVEKALDRYGMMWDVPGQTRRDRVEMLLDEFDLADIRNRRNVDLSIGQRRRVQVAREFMHDMDLLFLDEPTVGLDPVARRDLLDYLRDKVEETGMTIFYTTHILTEAEYLCDEIGIMNSGRLMEVDTPDALKSRLGAEKTIKIRLQQPLPQDVHDALYGMMRDGGCRVNFEGAGYGGGDDDDHNNNNNDDQKWQDGSICDTKHAGRRIRPRHARAQHAAGRRTSTTIIIRSARSESVLLEALRILRDADMEIEDLSAVPTSLEEVFLGMTGPDARSDAAKKGKVD